MTIQLDIRAILEHLPHRYPFLLVDRVLEVEPGRRIAALKNVTINEPFFMGHFPHVPVMPGVLIIEALAQTAGILSFQSLGRRSDTNSVYYFVGIDQARFRRPVVPGDQLRLEVDVVRVSRAIGRYRGRALVDGAVAAEAELMCTLRELDTPREPAASAAASTDRTSGAGDASGAADAGNASGAGNASDAVAAGVGAPNGA